MSETEVYTISREDYEKLTGKLDSVEKMLNEKTEEAKEQYKKSIEDRFDGIEKMLKEISEKFEKGAAPEEIPDSPEGKKKKGEGEEGEGGNEEKSLDEKVEEIFQKKIKEMPFVKGHKDSAGDDLKNKGEDQTFTKSLGAIFGVKI